MKPALPSKPGHGDVVEDVPGLVRQRLVLHARRNEKLLRALDRHPQTLWRLTQATFGDACVWWGLWLIACSVPWGWVTVFAPLLMTSLLLRVSGVSMLEQNMMQRPGHRACAERTSAFIPPRRARGDEPRTRRQPGSSSNLPVVARLSKSMCACAASFSAYALPMVTRRCPALTISKTSAARASNVARSAL